MPVWIIIHLDLQVVNSGFEFFLLRALNRFTDLCDLATNKNCTPLLALALHIYSFDLQSGIVKTKTNIYDLFT